MDKNTSAMVLKQNLTFNDLGIAPGIFQVLQGLRFIRPTPIQHKSIPVAIGGKDVIGIAQTGTGKTLAFGIPMIQQLARKKGQGLVLLPTRELALQVNEELIKIGRTLGLRTAVLIGGVSMCPQLESIRKNPHIIVATPGRLVDHLEQKNIRLDRVNILVLDEADRMLDMGFLPQMKKILTVVPKNRQTLLFSATLPAEIVSIASRYMHMPVRIEITPPGSPASQISQEVFVVRREEKSRMLEKVLADYKGRALVFTRTKHGAKQVARMASAMAHSAAEIHGNRSQNQRREALDGFKSGKYRVLVATDIASRGIDVRGIELVLNYDLPDQAEDYVHRIGRTARAGAEGHAISFVLPEEEREVHMIERLIKKNLQVSELPAELPPPRIVPRAPVGRGNFFMRPHGAGNRQKYFSRGKRNTPHYR